MRFFSPLQNITKLSPLNKLDSPNSYPNHPSNPKLSVQIVTRKKDYDSVITDKGQGSISRKQLSASITTLVVVLTFTACYGLWWFNSIMYLMWKVSEGTMKLWRT